MAETGSVPTWQLLLPAAGSLVCSLGNAEGELTQVLLPPAVTSGGRPPSPALWLSERCCHAAGIGTSLHRETIRFLCCLPCKVMQAAQLWLVSVQGSSCLVHQGSGEGSFCVRRTTTAKQNLLLG